MWKLLISDKKFNSFSVPMISNKNNIPEGVKCHNPKEYYKSD